MLELENGEVGRKSSLFSFFSNDSYSYICSEDHANIIASISNAKSLLFGVGLDLLSDVGFLSGRTTTAYNCINSAGKTEEHLLECVGHCVDGLAINNEHLVSLIVDVIAELVQLSLD